MSVFHLEQSAIEQLRDWLFNDYGLRHVFEFSCHGDRLTAGFYKTDAEGVRYLVCDHCGTPKNDDQCRDSRLVPATGSADMPLTSPPPVPVVAGRVKQ